MKKVERKQFSTEERQEILNKTSCKCGHCGKALTVDTMTIDHIVPIHKGGTHEEYNLVALCLDCNEDKSNFLYNIFDYYKYIDKKYEGNYSKTATRISKEYRQKSIFGLDSKVYKFFPYKQHEILKQMRSRGAKTSKVLDYADKMAVKVVLDKAYTGDAEAIMELLTKYNNKDYGFFDVSLYNSIYDIINDIKNSEVYVLRRGKTLCEVVAFKPFSEAGIELPQIDAIEETTRLMKKYIITLVYVDKFCCQIFPDLMEDIYDNLLRINAIPIYYNTLDRLYIGEGQFMSIPCEAFGKQGQIEFFTNKGMIERCKETMYDMNDFAKHSKSKDKCYIFSDEEIEKLSEMVIYDIDNEDNINNDMYKDLMSKISSNAPVASYFEALDLISRDLREID